MKRTLMLLLTALPMAGLVLPMIGCEDEPPPPPPQRVVVREYTVEPGYYYEPEYYDTWGYYHPRVYFYYDGHEYRHRDYIPRGYHARVRPHHEEHERWEHDRR